MFLKIKPVEIISLFIGSHVHQPLNRSLSNFTLTLHKQQSACMIKQIIIKGFKDFAILEFLKE